MSPVGIGSMSTSPSVVCGVSVVVVSAVVTDWGGKMVSPEVGVLSVVGATTRSAGVKAVMPSSGTPRVCSVSQAVAAIAKVAKSANISFGAGMDFILSLSMPLARGECGF